MDKDELLKKVSEELAATQMVLAKMLVIRECAAYNPRVTTIAKAWLARAKQGRRDDWETCAKALSTYIQVKDSKKANEALELLFPLDEKYQVGGGSKVLMPKEKSLETEQAIHILRRAYQPSVAEEDDAKHMVGPKTHGARIGAIEAIKQVVQRGKRYLVWAHHV